MNYAAEKNNRVFVMGEIVSDGTFSHEVYGEGFYEFYLRVLRLSGQADILPVTVSERLIEAHGLKKGSTIAAAGQFRSYNKLENGKSRLMLTVFVREIVEDVLIAVNRAYNKSDYIPCIAWGRNARFVRNLSVGDKVAISGRIQSREYQKKLSETEVKTMTAYEVSVSKLAAFDNEEDFDIESEFDLYAFRGENVKNDTAVISDGVG